ncbi:MAG TPA: rhodanese-like domain-containing protein, partial [bacterium]|nr:rhodanese-like domain-containing protein [bacterium]
MTATVSAVQLKAMLRDGQELALLDLREQGPFGEGHLLLASCAPLSRLELVLPVLVPRRSARVVLCDAGEGLADTAAQRMARWGYSQVSVLRGGIGAWEVAGYRLFSGVNVPSKAFGEFVEARCHTPNISAQELQGLMAQGKPLVVLDSRPWGEYQAMSVPGAVDVPGAELVYRVAELAPDPQTLVVVNCAGRTRSIIGAQSLINAGIPNQVVALRNGTMGWHLAGLQLDHDAGRRPPPVSPQGLRQAQAAAQRVAERFAVPSADWAQVTRWQKDAARSLFLLDVRSEEEFLAGHLPGARWAPGGQLVQATDTYVGTRGARLVLVDDTQVRATLTASWLLQMGWPEVCILRGGLSAAGVPLETGAAAPAVLGGLPACAEVSPAELARSLAGKESSVVVDLATSAQYQAGHIPGAWFAIRARLSASLPQLPRGTGVVLTSPDGLLARLAAPEAAAILGAPVRVLAGGTAAWRQGGQPLATGPEHLADPPDDLWLRPYDREQGVEAAMQRYLDWELG